MIRPFAALLVLASIATAGIDFTPVLPTNDSPAMKRFPRILFKDGARTVSYVPPPGWVYAGSAAGLRLEANDASHTQATIQQLTRKNPTGFDAEAIDALTRALIAALPPGTKDPTVMHVERNPLRLAGAETLEIVVGYFAIGKMRTRSVLFVNLADTQLQFALTSLQSEFATAHAKFRRSYYSWQWVD